MFFPEARILHVDLTKREKMSTEISTRGNLPPIPRRFSSGPLFNLARDAGRS
jgi:hypothetical protein